LAALKKIGELWHDDKHYQTLPKQVLPIISSNLAKKKFSESSWSDDMNIMDFGNDDNFNTSWVSNPEVKHPWYEVDLGKEQAFNMIVLTEGGHKPSIKKYRIEYFVNNKWQPLLTGEDASRTKIHRFPTVWGNKVRILIDSFDTPPAIAEFGVYDERR
jgi:alpha-L-fucosidase